VMYLKLSRITFLSRFGSPEFGRSCTYWTTPDYEKYIILFCPIKCVNWILSSSRSRSDYFDSVLIIYGWKIYDWTLTGHVQQKLVQPLEVYAGPLQPSPLPSLRDMDIRTVELRGDICVEQETRTNARR